MSSFLAGQTGLGDCLSASSDAPELLGWVLFGRLRLEAQTFCLDRPLYFFSCTFRFLPLGIGCHGFLAADGHLLLQKILPAFLQSKDSIWLMIYLSCL